MPTTAQADIEAQRDRIRNLDSEDEGINPVDLHDTSLSAALEDREAAGRRLLSLTVRRFRVID